MIPDINIPTAAEARKKIEQLEYAKAQRQIQAVQTLVTTAIANGSRQTSYDGCLDEPVAAALRAKGYKVDQGSSRNEDYCNISW